MPNPARSSRPVTRSLFALVAASTLVLTLLVAGPATAEPSAEQLRAQQREAVRLQELAKAQGNETAAAKVRLAALATAAGQALDDYVSAERQAEAAREREAAERARHEMARRTVLRERRNLGRFAASAYRNGGPVGELGMIAALLDADSITQMGRMAADLQYAGTQQSHAVDRLVAAEVAAAQAAQSAAEAKQVAVGAERRARVARAKADRLVAQQRALVRTIERQAARTRDAAKEARDKAARMAQARRIAEQRRREAERRRQEALRRGQVVQVSIPAGACRGGNVSGYPNGQIPRSALCPLWGAEWHVLRADAAAAFNAMSKAYAARFGRPILVTDSYRSYEMQLACTAAKGSLCATPGTSNHGWGTAVDLGDGVNSFGTTTHEWMRQNAPRFGWFHPGWAEPGGNKPEPWHWEFGG